MGSKEAQRRLKGGSSKLKILEIGWGEARTDAQSGLKVEFSSLQYPLENYKLRNMVRFRAILCLGYLSSVNVCNFIDNLGVSASIEISWLRYHVKTRARRGSSFSHLGLEPNHTGWTAQSLFFLEESCRVKRSDTQTFSNYFKRFLKL